MVRYPKYEKTFQDCTHYLKYLSKSTTSERDARMTLATADIEILCSLQAIMNLGQRYMEMNRKSPAKNAIAVFRSWRRDIEGKYSDTQGAAIDALLADQNYKLYLQYGMNILAVK